MLRNGFLDFVVEHWFGCRTTEPGFAGDIGAKEVLLIDWLSYKKLFWQRCVLDVVAGTGIRMPLLPFLQILVDNPTHMQLSSTFSHLPETQ